MILYVIIKIYLSMIFSFRSRNGLPYDISDDFCHKAGYWKGLIS